MVDAIMTDQVSCSWLRYLEWNSSIRVVTVSRSFVHRAITLIAAWTTAFAISIMWQFVHGIFKRIITSNGKLPALAIRGRPLSTCAFRILIVDFDYHMGDGVKVKLFSQSSFSQLNGFFSSRTCFTKIQGDVQCWLWPSFFWNFDRV